MTTPSAFRSMLVGWLGLATVACSSLPAPPRPQEPMASSFDGLAFVPNPDGEGALYVRANHQIGSYDAFQIDPVVIAYRREARIPPQPDTQRMRRHLSESLATGLARTGVPITDAPGHCVLRIGVQLIDAELFEFPRPSSSTTSFVQSWGRFILVQELRDSVSGEALLRYSVKRTIAGSRYYGESGLRDWGAIESALDDALEGLRRATTERLPPSSGAPRADCSGTIARATEKARSESLPAAPARGR